MNAFWIGFEKCAEGALTGGQGHTGAGKGNLGHFTDRSEIDGTQEGHGRSDGGDTRTDKTLLDRDRGPRTEDPFGTGPELQDESNPHIRY